MTTRLSNQFTVVEFDNQPVAKLQGAIIVSESFVNHDELTLRSVDSASKLSQIDVIDWDAANLPDDAKQLLKSVYP